MKGNQLLLKSPNKRQTHLLNLTFQLFIFFLHYSLVSNYDEPKYLYFKTDGEINLIQKFDASKGTLESINNIDYSFSSKYYYFKFDSRYKDNIILKLKTQDSDRISIGFYLKIKDTYYVLNDTNFTVVFDKEIECNSITKINYMDVPYCFIKNTNEAQINITVPFNSYDYDCYITCSSCNRGGNEDHHHCTQCKNEKGYYFKEKDSSKNCFNSTNIEKG